MMRHRLLAWTDSQIEILYPGCFAFVMATGIISNALFAENFRRLSDLLFATAALGFLWLMALSMLRAARFPNAVRSDLMNPLCVFAFFTLVAATDVIGAGIYLRGFAALAFYLWLVALVVWCILFYFSFAVWIFANAGSGADVLQGGWLLAIVATQSLAVLGASVVSRAGSFDTTILVFSHMLWGVGLALYAIYMTLFIYRIVFFAVGPDDPSPALWVVMGAAAITTNAGSALVETGSKLAYLNAMRPFLESATLIVWAWATLWIPLLVLMGLWNTACCSGG
jgi:tellurite resistance protein TehA-like permease